MSENSKAKEESVTVIISRRVKSGKEKEFNEWAAGISLEAQKFEGYIGKKTIQPSSHTDSKYVVIIRFNNYENLKNWENSSVRAIWIDRAKDFTEGEVNIQKLTGLEFWFNLQETQVQSPPPRYKMSIVTYLALYPTINIVNLIFDPLLGSLHGYLRMAISVMVTILLMTYIIMPVMARLFSSWLNNNRKSG